MRRTHLKIHPKDRPILWAIASLIALNAVAGIFLHISIAAPFKKELKELYAHPLKNTSEATAFFSEVAKAKGGSYAYDLLKIAPLARNMEIHLIGHEIGHYLYDEYGVDAITRCTADFGNACSHTVVIDFFLDEGPSAFEKITEACSRAGGGRGAYNMCIHGLGHGVLAYNGYDLPVGLDMCQKNFTGRPLVECIGGNVMELISGLHDKELAKKQSEVYFKKSDPLYPCDADFMPIAGRPICYTYLTPHLFNSFDKRIIGSTDSDKARAFSLCNKIKLDEEKNACFGGFGKEFVLLANDKDNRMVGKMSVDRLSKIAYWCSLAKDEAGIDSCVRGALGNMYWGGANDPKVSIDFCSLYSGQRRGTMCMNTLLSTVAHFKKDDSAYLDKFCASVPNEYKNACSNRFLVK